MTPDSENAEQANWRLRGLAIHFSVFLLVVGLFAVVDFVYFPGRIYTIYPVVIWGAPLSLHVAYVMGLFDIFRSSDT